jgi:preprotein translocase subunit SecB
MADETQGSAAPQPGATPTGPTLNIVGQYIKDLSFENPRAPQSLLTAPSQPKFNITINVGVNKQTDEIYAVDLTLNAKAERDSGILFSVELVYGGIFRIRNVPDNQLGPLLMIECPRLIFPFARQILANITQAGGFPPLLMDPVDFTAIYRQNLAALAQQQQNAGGQGSPVDPSKAN